LTALIIEGPLDISYADLPVSKLTVSKSKYEQLKLTFNGISSSSGERITKLTHVNKIHSRFKKYATDLNISKIIISTILLSD
jgi:hypothetical protein